MRIFVVLSALIALPGLAEARTSDDIVKMFNENPAAMLIDGKPIIRAERGPFGTICAYDKSDQLISCQGKKEMNKLIDKWVKGGSKKPTVNEKPSAANKAMPADKSKSKSKAQARVAPTKAPTKANALKAMANLKEFKAKQVAVYSNAANGQPEVWISDKSLSSFPSFETKAKFKLSCKDDWGDAMFTAVTLKGQVINGALFVTNDQAGNGAALEKIGRGLYPDCSVGDAKWKINWQVD